MKISKLKTDAGHKNGVRNLGSYISSVTKKKAEGVAKHLERLTAHFSIRTWYILLLIFLLLGTGLCLYIIYSSIFGIDKQLFIF